MGYDQDFPTTGLKFTNCQGQIYYDNDWIAGVEYDEYEQQENEIDDDNEEIDYEEQQQELAEVLHEPPEANPTINDGEEDEENNDEQQVEQEVDNEDEEEQPETEQPTEPATGRSTRVRKEVDRLNLNMHGETTKSNEMQVKFLDKELEYKHNLFTEVSPNPHADVEYSRDQVLLIAKTMVDFNCNGTTNKWSFGQQHILQKGLKLFKDMMQ